LKNNSTQLQMRRALSLATRQCDEAQLLLEERDEALKFLRREDDGHLVRLDAEATQALVKLSNGLDQGHFPQQSAISKGKTSWHWNVGEIKSSRRSGALALDLTTGIFLSAPPASGPRRKS
jgi:hypothetical protein